MGRFACVLSLILCGVSTVAGDGLVFTLPEDKTAAVYDMQIIFEQKEKKVVQRGTVTVASVGRLEVADVKLRWLEIAINTAEEKDTYRMIYKVLVPEKFLQEGGSPAECILKCWWTRKIRPKDLPRAELLEKHPHDSRWAYLPTFILTGALTEKKQLAGVEMMTLFGMAKCGGVAGRFDYEQETRNWQTKVETRLHPKAPFGVVASRAEFQMERDGQKISGVAAFKLIEVNPNYQGELAKYQ